MNRRPATMMNAPTGVGAKFDRARILHQQGELLRAEALYRDILNRQPSHVGALTLLGVIVGGKGQFERAVQLFDKAIAVKPDLAAAYLHRGRALFELARVDAALASYDRAIALQADFVEAHLDRGNVLRELGRLDAALASYDRAIAIKPDFVHAYCNRGAVLYELGRFEAALADYDRAISIKPDDAESHFNRGNALRALKQYDAAAASYDRAAALRPGIPFLAGDRLEVRMQICDWTDFDARVADIAARIELDEAVTNPFCFMAVSNSASLQKQAARIWVRERYPPDASLGAFAPRAAHAKIRVGYFSADFRDHPVSTLMAGIFEEHDRARFEITAFSFGVDTHDAMRQRVAKTFDRFIDVRAASDRDIALLSRRLQIDIAIDLGGFTENSRPRIFALRAAPSQVSYIGYLGTLGADYMDYLIADRTLIPEADQRHYCEKIVYIPSYQANDSQRPVACHAITRVEWGLPATGFVFCCFNPSYKITPSTFAGWMRVLSRVPHSVLWLYADSGSAVHNLRREARAQGVDPARLVFGERLSMAQYLGRFCAADLFLDTLPYNAGTTASDALWVGLPVLTRVGETLSGRVAASLLRTLGLTELIAVSQSQYEDMAVALAMTPERLAAIKQQLSDIRHTTRLFNARSFTRHLESAYIKIHQRYRAGLEPDHIHADSV